MKFKLEKVNLSSGSFIVLMIDRECNDIWDYANEEEMEIFADSFMN